MTLSRRHAAARLHAQLLDEPATSPEDAVHRILAVQAQDARAFRLAVRARSLGGSASDVDGALSDRRTLVVSWLCRGTLHLVTADDYWWLHELTAPRQLAANVRRLAQLGVTEPLADRGVGVVLDEVAAAPRSREQLAAALADAGVPTAGQALVHVLAAASFRAHLVRGAMVDGQHCFVDATRWLTRPTETDAEERLRRLGRRYLAGHGPAAARDLATFCGITLSDARRAFALVEEETTDLDGRLVALPGKEAPSMPAPRLLGMFDPVLHGWSDRAWVVDGPAGVVTSNGVFRASVLVHGRVGGVWSLPDGTVTVRPFVPLGRGVVRALRREATDVLRFLGLPDAPMRIQPAQPPS